MKDGEPAQNPRFLRASALFSLVMLAPCDARAPAARVRASACQPPVVRGEIVTRASLLAGMNGFAATAGTTGGLGRRLLSVTRDDDTADEGTLRWAAMQAKRAGGGWIRFAPALIGHSLQLSQPIRLPGNVTLDGGLVAPTLVAAPGQAILVITGVSNVVVANIKLRSNLTTAPYKGNGDCITIAHGADRIWIAHNLIGRCGDGQVDITQNSAPRAMRITVAFNHFTSQDKVSLVQGNVSRACVGKESGRLPPLTATFYRNYFDHTGQRHPRAGGAAFVHSVENVVEFEPQSRDRTGLGGAYGAAATAGASMLVERSLFRSLVGSDRLLRFFDTRAVAEGSGACLLPGRLRVSQVVTEPAAPIQQADPTDVPAPPYRIRTSAPDLQTLFARVRADAGPHCTARP